jgi:hypothetical protein
VSESNIAVLAVGAALACGAILLGDPQPAAISAVNMQPVAAPLTAASAPRRVADATVADATVAAAAVAAATIDCVAHPETAGCSTQIVANVASAPNSLSPAEEALHAPTRDCVGAPDATMQGDCSAVSGDAVAL